MPARVTIRLTVNEAVALSWMAEHAMRNPEAVTSLFGHSSARDCGARAARKVRRVIGIPPQQRPPDPLPLLEALAGYCEQYRRAGSTEMPKDLLRRCRKALAAWEMWEEE